MKKIIIPLIVIFILSVIAGVVLATTIKTPMRDWTAFRGIGVNTLVPNSELDVNGILTLETEIAPIISPADAIQMYSADYSAGHSCLHIRNEDGTIVQLNQNLATGASPQFAGQILTPVLSLPSPAIQNKIIILDDKSTNYVYFGKMGQTDAVAQWKMNDNGVNNTVIESVNGLTGTSQRNTSLMSVAGKVNTALNFNGTDDYIVVSNNDLLNFGTGDFAISFWIKTQTTSIARIINKMLNVSPYTGFDVWLESGNLKCLLSDDTGYTSGTFTDFSLVDNAWHHVVLNFDRDSNLTPYIDSSSYTAKDISSKQGSINVASDLTIGAKCIDFLYKFTGILDDIRLYKRLLTMTEIALLYNAGNGAEYGEKPYWQALAGSNVFDKGIISKNGSTSAGYIDLYEDADNGTNYLRHIADANMPANQTVTWPAAMSAGYLKSDANGNLSIDVRKAQIHFDIDGGGSVITTGAKAWVRVPYNMTIQAWDITADQSGSIVIDVWKDTYANFPPTVADTIAGTEKPTLSAAQKNQDTNLTTWTTAVSAGDYIRINVDSASTVTKVCVDIYGVKN